MTSRVTSSIQEHVKVIRSQIFVFLSENIVTWTRKRGKERKNIHIYFYCLYYFIYFEKRDIYCIRKKKCPLLISQLWNSRHMSRYTILISICVVLCSHNLRKTAFRFHPRFAILLSSVQATLGISLCFILRKGSLYNNVDIKLNIFLLGNPTVSLGNVFEKSVLSGFG